MEDSKLISVIIPVYNGEKYLAQCIENMLCQTYTKLEIIVIDDGSKDNSAKIAEQYPVKLFRQENKGLSAARNMGVSLTSGDYIHFMDVDDLLNLEYYEKMMEALLQADADMACGGMINEIKPHRSTLYDYRFLLMTTDDKLSSTKVGKYGYVWRYVFKKSLLTEHHLQFEEGRLIEDLAFSLAAVYFAKKIVTVPGAVYFYKLRVNSITQNENSAFIKRRHDDLKHAREVRQQFATEHHFEIPGATKNGFIPLLAKWIARLGGGFRYF